MALKFKVTSLEGLDDSVKALYKEVDGGFQLDVEGVAPKERVNEFRENNVQLMKEIDSIKQTLGGIDVTAFNEFMNKQADNKEQELLKAGKIDELVALRSEAMKTKYETQIQSLTNNNSQLNERLRTTLIDGELSKIAVSAGVKSTAVDDVLLRGKNMFSLGDDGSVVARNGEQVKYNADNKPYSINDFVSDLKTSAPHLFTESTGGGVNNTKVNKNNVNVQSTVAKDDKRNWDLDKIISGEQKVV